MVKKKVGGGQRYRAVAKALARSSEAGKDKAAGNDAGLTRVPDRVKRKVGRKVQFLEKVAKSSIAAKDSVRKKSKSKKRASDLAVLGNLSSLSESLEAAAAKLPSDPKTAKFKQIPSKPKLNKRRQVVNVTEAARVQLVLQHPQYRADPIAAITNHLKSSLPAAPPPPAANKGKKQQRQKKRKKNKKQDDPNTMEAD